MSHPARMPRSIRLTQLADTVAGCEDCLATGPEFAFVQVSGLTTKLADLLFWVGWRQGSPC